MTIPSHSDADYDAVVIGSGAGGCAAVYELVRAGLRVALIEKGRDLPTDSSTLDVAAVIGEGRFKSKETWLDGHGRAFQPEEYFNIGGKTKWYGAALFRFGRHEFAADTAHGCGAWPIGYDDLAPFYETAERHLQVRTFACEPALARIAAKLQAASPDWRLEPMPMGLAADIASNPREASHFDGFAGVAGLKHDAESAFLARVRDAPNLAIFMGMPVVELLGHSLDPLRIEGVKLADGRTLKARSVILAMGALHSPRILQRYLARNHLRSRIACPEAIGGNLKLHLLTAVIALSPSLQPDLIRKTSVFLNDRLPHSTVQPLGFDSDLIASLIPGFLPRALARFMGRRAYGFFLQTEDGSSIENRVIEAAGGDDCPTLDYDEVRLRPAREEHGRLVKDFCGALGRAGLIGIPKRIGLAGTAHSNGTLIAGNDPRNSAVDAYGKVHGLDSLYVMDGSVLPRSSRVNPSLTIYAWGLRAANHLAKELTAPRRQSAAREATT